MIQRSETTPSFKLHKSCHSPQTYFSFHQPLSSPISPIPIIYRRVQNDKKMRTRLAVNGYKNFSKLSACGEDAPLTLGNVVKSRNVKYIRKFEFDPYFCEKSHMKLLGKTLKKFKDIQSFNLVIRRLDYIDESDILEPFMIRLIRLKKFRLELIK